MTEVRTFALVYDGAIIETVPPLPLSPAWLEVMPADGDARKLYGYPLDMWVEITGMTPIPQPNWLYANGVFSEPLPPPPLDRAATV